MSNTIFFERKSKRAFLDKEVPLEIVDHIFEVVRWTPSCANNQPWRFLVIQEPEQRKIMMGTLVKGNAWAAAAPTLVVVFADKNDDYIRSDDEVSYHLFDTGMATMSFLLAAVDEGLMAHPMAGYNADAVKRTLGIPLEYNVMCIIALGYEGFLEQLDYDTREKDKAPRTRKDPDDFIHYEQFTF